MNLSKIVDKLLGKKIELVKIESIVQKIPIITKQEIYSYEDYKKDCDWSSYDNRKNNIKEIIKEMENSYKKKLNLPNDLKQKAIDSMDDFSRKKYYENIGDKKNLDTIIQQEIAYCISRCQLYIDDEYPHRIHNNRAETNIEINKLVEKYKISDDQIKDAAYWGFKLSMAYLIGDYFCNRTFGGSRRELLEDVFYIIDHFNLNIKKNEELALQLFYTNFFIGEDKLKKGNVGMWNFAYSLRVANKFLDEQYQKEAQDKLLLGYVFSYDYLAESDKKIFQSTYGDFQSIYGDPLKDIDKKEIKKIAQEAFNISMNLNYYDRAYEIGKIYKLKDNKDYLALQEIYEKIE